jgi:hypothetical protein
LPKPCLGANTILDETLAGADAVLTPPSPCRLRAALAGRPERRLRRQRCAQAGRMRLSSSGAGRRRRRLTGTCVWAATRLGGQVTAECGIGIADRARAIRGAASAPELASLWASSTSQSRLPSYAPLQRQSLPQPTPSRATSRWAAVGVFPDSLLGPRGRRACALMCPRRRAGPLASRSA